MLLEIGKKAPEFSLVAGDGKTYALGDFRGKNLIVYFYPKDLTPGCTIEAQQFQVALPQLKKLNTAVVGVSKDTPALHQKFAAECALQFPLLSDPDGSMIAAYGAWQEKSMYGKKYMGIARITYLLGPDGAVLKYYSKVTPKTHAGEVLADLETRD